MNVRPEVMEKIRKALEENREAHDEIMQILAGLPSAWDATVLLAMLAAWTAHLIGRDVFLNIFETLYESSQLVATRKKEMIRDVLSQRVLQDPCPHCGAAANTPCDPGRHNN